MQFFRGWPIDIYFPACRYGTEIITTVVQYVLKFFVYTEIGSLNLES